MGWVVERDNRSKTHLRSGVSNCPTNGRFWDDVQYWQRGLYFREAFMQIWLQALSLESMEKRPQLAGRSYEGEESHRKIQSICCIIRVFSI